MSRVIFSFLGSQLDRGQSRDRWNSWRPNVAICQHEEFLVDRFELVYESRDEKLAKVVVEDIAAVSPETKVNLHRVDLADAWDFEEVYTTLHSLLREFRFNTDRDEYFAHITTGTHVEQICWFLLTESRHLPGCLLQASPPRKKQLGDMVGFYRVIDLDLSKYDRLASRFDLERKADLSFLKAGIETRNAAFNATMEQLEHVAIQSDAPVLLTGPTGAGKTHLARRVYELKKRRDQITGDFVELNCATLRGDQTMSAMFGHVKGAFTGAEKDRAGLLRAANGGMLFLDEIGELGADEQAMLLRAVEEGRFLPVGADQEVRSQFQLLAGTNRDLAADVRRGRFREDLLARINLWTFRLPGLAERREDIQPNLQFELDAYASRTGTQVRFNRPSRQRFLQFAVSPAAVWKGNFRDLNAAVTRMATLSINGRINEDIVHEEIERLREAWSDGATDAGEEILSRCLTDAQRAKLDMFDRLQLSAILQLCEHAPSLSAAGRELFQQSRLKKATSNDADRLRKYLARFGITWSDIQAG